MAPGVSSLPYSEVIYLLFLVVYRIALAQRQRRPAFSVPVIGGVMVTHAVVFNPMSPLAMNSTLLAVQIVQSCLSRPSRWLFLGSFTTGSGLTADLAPVAVNPRRDPLGHVILVGTVLLAVVVMVLAGVNRRAASSRTERALEWVVLLEVQQGALHRLAVAEERARPARGLHDVLGYALVTIVIQTEGALPMSEYSPEHSWEALRNMAATSRRGVDETRALMGVSQNDEGVPTSPVSEPERAPRRTSPDLSSKIVMLAEGTGLPIRVTLDLPQRAMSPPWAALVLGAVKEALASVAGYIRFIPIRLPCALIGTGTVLDMKNGLGPRGIGPGGISHTGAGLPGLWKRTMALGATLNVGPGDDGWRVSLTVPREPQRL